MPRQVQTCPFEGCHKTFTHLNNFWYHINMHKGEKPAKCTLCPQAFRSNSHLKQHLKKKHQVDQDQNGLEECSNKRKTSSPSQPDFGNRVKLTEKKPIPTKSNPKIRPRQFSPAQAVVRNKHSKSEQPIREYGNQKCYNGSRTQENNIRIKNQAESCSWKKDMQHLFFIPYNALNPEFLFDFESDVHRYWYRPLNSFYSGYIPITRLPVHCRVVHDVSTSIHVKISSGWEKALVPESYLRRFTGYKVKQETSSSDVLPSAEFKQSTVGHLSFLSTDNQFRNMPPHFSDQRLPPPSQTVVNRGIRGSLLECGYCGKYFYDKDTFSVHIAVHKGYGFKFSKCKVCGKRFLDKLKFEAHLKLHVIKTSPSSSPCLPIKITFDKASKKKQCKYCTFSTRNMHLFRMHFSRHSM